MVWWQTHTSVLYEQAQWEQVQAFRTHSMKHRHVAYWNDLRHRLKAAHRTAHCTSYELPYEGFIHERLLIDCLLPAHMR